GWAARPLQPPGPLRRGVPAAGEPLERDRGAAARRPARVRHARPLPRGARLAGGGIPQAERPRPARRAGLCPARARKRRPPQPARIRAVPRVADGRAAPTRGVAGFRRAQYVAGTAHGAANRTAHALLEKEKDPAAEQPRGTPDRAGVARG